MTHDDVFARLADADPLPDDALITEGDLGVLASLVDEARATGAAPGTRPAPLTATSDTTRPIRDRWTLRPALVAAIAAAALLAIVGITAVLTADRGTAPASDPPGMTTVAPIESTTTSVATTTQPTTTPPSVPVVPIATTVAALEWQIMPLSDALDSGVLGFDRSDYEGGDWEAGLNIYERLRIPEPWPADLPVPGHDCMGGWNGEQILESPGRIVAICDIGDWTPERVRTWAWEDDAWVEVPTEPVLWSGWANGDGNRDGSLGPAGTFGAATDIGDGFMANGTADYLWASEDGIMWVQVPDTADAFPERSVTRAIGTSNGLVYIVGELDWPPEDPDGDRPFVVWIAELPDQGGRE